MKLTTQKMAELKLFSPAAIPNLSSSCLIQEVPEVSDGTIIIDKIVREAGYRTKLTVRSTDPKVDPVGACVGMRGARVKNIVRELHNEKIDIIPFSQDPMELLQNALESDRNPQNQHQ